MFSRAVKQYADEPLVFERSVVPFVLSHPAAEFSAAMNPHIALFKRKHDTIIQVQVTIQYK